jgi:Plasmid pRiA4b ORF-3-like protein
MQQMLDLLAQQTFVGGKRVAVEDLPPLPEQAATTVHQVKVSLHGAKPPVWRRLEVPSAMRLDLVHEVMQVAFDWHGLHLHVFETVCGEFGVPDSDDDWAERKDETTAALAQVAVTEKTKVVYAYDFGDDWRHDVVVEKITSAEPGVAYPRCTGGRRLPPWEGCGGIEAFNRHQATWPDTFSAGDMTAQLAGLAKVIIPAS